MLRFRYILCSGICGICRTEKGRALGDKGAAHHCLRKRHQHKQVWHSARLRLFRAEAQDSSAPPTAKIVARAGNAMTTAQQWTTFTQRVLRRHFPVEPAKPFNNLWLDVRVLLLPCDPARRQNSWALEVRTQHAAVTSIWCRPRCARGLLGSLVALLNL